MSKSMNQEENTGLKELKAQNKVFSSWLYALDKLSLDLVQDGSLVELAADIIIDQIFSRSGVNWRLFERPLDACNWYLKASETVKNFIENDPIKLFGKDHGRIEVQIGPGCPYGLDKVFSVCKRAAVFVSVIKRCTEMDYAYKIEQANPEKGCRFVLYPNEKRSPNLFTKKQVINLIQAFTEEAEAVMPGLIERTGRGYAMKLAGDLEQGLAEFNHTGLGSLVLDNCNLEKGPALFVGQGLLQGSGGQSDIAVDSFTKGFLAGLVSRLSGVDVNCEEMTCVAKGDEQCTFIVDTARKEERHRLREIAQAVKKIGFTPTFHHLTLLAAKELGLLKSHLIDFKLTKYSTMRDLSESLRHGELDGALILAPLAIRLRQEGVPIKAVALAHREGLGLVVNNNSSYTNPGDLFSGTSLLAVSQNNVLLHKWLKDLNVANHMRLLKTISLPMELMLRNLGYGEIDAFLAPEPYVTEAESKGKGRVLAVSRDIWPGHICCILVLTVRFLNENPDGAAQIVHGIHRAGKFLHNDQKTAAKLVEKYFGLPRELFTTSLQENRISYNHLEPDVAQFEAVQEIMLEMGQLREKIPMEEFIDQNFLHT